MAKDDETAHYDGPSGGFGSIKGVARIFGEAWATPMALEIAATKHLPDGCIGAYPEMNPLIPLWYNDKLSKTPAAKGVPVRIVA